MSDVVTLLDELAACVAEACGLSYKTVPEGQARQLYVHRMDRREADQTASVLRLTGGPAGEYLPTLVLTVQCLTQAATEAEALARAWAIHDCFVTDAGLPQREISLSTWRIVRIDAMQRPSAIGPLAGGGADVSFNWLIEAAPLAA
ncbi:MAG TPA: hypothetical protein VMW52_10585 [Phycisphaerae bacterium]|nr:hypothetical protein [Phycisphaerae bacterium]